MKDAQLISRWRRCETLAHKLGMVLGTNHTEMLSAQGRENATGHKGFYSCETVNELLGYLEGLNQSKP